MNRMEICVFSVLATIFQPYRADPREINERLFVVELNLRLTIIPILVGFEPGPLALQAA